MSNTTSTTVAPFESTTTTASTTAFNNTNTTLAPNNNNDDGVLQGVCSPWNDAFLIILGTSAAAFVFILVASWSKTGKPSKGSTSYGVPYGILILFAELCFWNVVPQALLFFIFKVFTENLLPDSSAMACITAGSGLPIVPFYFLLLAFSFLFTANNAGTRAVVYEKLLKECRSLNQNESSSTNNAADQVMTPQESQQQQQETIMSPGSINTAPKILVIGALQRGTVFAEFRKSVLEKYPAATVMNLDFAGLSDHIRNNLVSLGAAKDEEEAAQIVVAPPEFSQADIAQFYYRQKQHAQGDAADTQGAGGGDDNTSINNNSKDTSILIVKGGQLPAFFDTSRLGLKVGFFDEIVLLPFIRNQPPMGGFLSGEAVKMLRVVDMLRSVSNTLRPGGCLTGLDVVGSGIMLERDIHDTGIYDRISMVADESTLIGPLGFRSHMVAIKAHKKRDDAVSRARLETDESNVFASMEAATGTYLGPFTKLTIIAMTQTVVFLVLLFIAAALFHPTNVPTSVPLSSRVNSVFVSIATNYVMIAYLARQALVEEVPMTGVGMVVTIVLAADVKVILGSIAYTLLFWLPTFLLALALAETSLSNTVQSIIGIVISIYIGFFAYKRGQKQSMIKTLKSRGVSEENINKLIK